MVVVTFCYWICSQGLVECCLLAVEYVCQVHFIVIVYINKWRWAGMHCRNHYCCSLLESIKGLVVLCILLLLTFYLVIKGFFAPKVQSILCSILNYLVIQMSLATLSFSFFYYFCHCYQHFPILLNQKCFTNT